MKYTSRDKSMRLNHGGFDANTRDEKVFSETINKLKTSISLDSSLRLIAVAFVFNTGDLKRRFKDI